MELLLLNNLFKYDSYYMTQPLLLHVNQTNFLVIRSLYTVVSILMLSWLLDLLQISLFSQLKYQQNTQSNHEYFQYFNGNKIIMF